MTASSIATVVVFASIGILSLALALIARRYSVTALTIGLAGLFALTTAATWNTRAGSGDVQVIGNLKAEIALAKKELQTWRERNEELAKRDEARRVDSDQIRTDLATTQQEVRRLTADLEAKRAEITELKKKLSEAQRALPSTPVPERTPVNAGTLRRKLDNHLDKKFYASQPLGQTELVAGRRGNWYVMRLQRGGKPFVFGDRQFRMPEAMQEIKESLLVLQEELLEPVKRVANRSDLFLRGGADSRRVAGATEVPDARELLVLPRSRDGNYEKTPRRLLPTEPVRNEDLPNLRADWLREQIRSVLPTVGSADIEILENPPSPGHERTVDLILYVEW
jgi:hypothetical protein